MKKINIRMIGILILIVSVMYPLNIMLSTGHTLKMALFGGVGNFTLLSDIGFINGIILIIVSFLRKEKK